MLKWWFLLVFLPNFRNDMKFSIFIIGVITLLLGIGFVVCYFDDGSTKECLKIGKIFKKSVISLVVLLIVISISPSKKQLIEVFAANVFLTKNNTEIISKIPNEGLKYLDKIIQEKIKETDKKGE